MYYYYLLDLFGRVPIVTSPDIAMADVAQSSRADVFRFVTQELEEVVPDLALEKSNLPGMYYGRITRPVAWFLLAKLYLNAPVYAGEEHYDQVVMYCDLVSSLGYDLEPDYSANFAVYNEASVENIFTIPMDKHLYSAENQYLFRSRHYDHAAAIGFVGGERILGDAGGVAGQWLREGVGRSALPDELLERRAHGPERE